jgi:molybdopterin-biosynthesis enzyme MoeA-like protein
MDGGQSFLQKGMEIVKQAVVADNADELEKALSLYKQGIHSLSLHIEC